MSLRDSQFFHPFRVRYSEIDGQKVVFNAHYLTYFDTAITEYFRWLPFNYSTYVDHTSYDFHTARSVVEYKSPIYFDEEILVYVRISKVGRSSLTYVIGLYVGDEEKPRATGEVVWVHIDRKTGKSSALDKNLVTRIHNRGEGKEE